ncbi:ABC transporter permease [Tenacibaculum sp. M341]|uniref:ABC transporter permease n=1 Tax=Tenacibaculum sp. M341 TaxID=2530339 RepID=UPI0010454DD6|nr:ABC transporter permease [Tenacibaculum sp. M341]TCI84591.1 ABC transporter permease [Tenacibaculum sp. M341]
MIINNLKLFVRNALRYKSVSLINIIGLSAGLACALFICLWIYEEWTVDKFHENEPELYQAMVKSQESNGTAVYENTPPVLAQAIKNEIPEVTNAIPYIYDFAKNVISVENTSFKLQGIYAGEEFFEMFSYNLIQGNPETALRDINNIVISKEMAINFFGTSEGVLGKSIKLNNDRVKQISGVFDMSGLNSSMQFDYVFPYEVLYVHIPRVKKNWNNSYVHTYLQLSKGASAELVESKVKNIIAQNSNNKAATVFIRPFSSKYLYGKYEEGVQAGGRIDYVKTFGIIVFFILVVACINFINLSTANASRRMREIGVKKSMGAKTKELRAQFFGESILTVSITGIIALLIVVLLLPHFNAIAGKQITLSFNTTLIGIFLGMIVFTGVLAGSYPAIYLSKLNAVEILKGKLSTSFSELLMRKGLVIFQFSLSVILIVAVMVIYQQMKFIQSKDLGYNKDNIIAFKAEGKAVTQLDDFLLAMDRIPGVEYASSMFNEFIGQANSTGDLIWKGKDPSEIVDMQYMRVNYDMLELLGIQMKTGRFFSRKFSNDGLKIIFNEKAIDLMGMEDPIGKTVELWGEQFEILGIAKDFHTESLQEQVKPMFIICNTKRTSTIMVKVKSGGLQGTIRDVERFYTEYNPGFPFEYKFIDEDFEALYRSEQRIATLSKYFAGLAIIISSLGLFGLAIFTSENRRKEVGIRRALGQKRTQIILLLTSEFAKLVGISILIGLPIAYLLTRDWLTGFAYKVDLNLGYFLLAGLMAMAIALATVSYQAIQAAYKNPVEALKDE